MTRTGCRDCWPLARSRGPRAGARLSAGRFCRVVADVRDDGVQGGFERVGGVLGPGEEQSALHGGEQCEGKPARVGIAWQAAVAGHGGQAGADRLGPGGEAGGQGVAGQQVVVGQFAGQAAQLAAAGAVLLPGGVDHYVAPCAEGAGAVEPGQRRVPR